MSKECPLCGLINPPNAERCDCSYNFNRGTAGDTEVPVSAKDRPRAYQGAAIAIALFMCLPVGIIVWITVMR